MVASVGSGFADPASIVRSLLAVRERKCAIKLGSSDPLTCHGILRLYRWNDWDSGLGI